MDLIISKLPELRCIYRNIKSLKQINSYIKMASSSIIKILFEIALNKIFSNKNKIKLKKII